MVIFMVWQKKTWWCSCWFHRKNTGGLLAFMTLILLGGFVHWKQNLKWSKKQPKKCFLTIYTTIIHTVKYIDILYYSTFYYSDSSFKESRSSNVDSIHHPLPILSQGLGRIGHVGHVGGIGRTMSGSHRPCREHCMMLIVWSNSAGPGSMSRIGRFTSDPIMTNVVVHVVCHVSATAVSGGCHFLYIVGSAPPNTCHHVLSSIAEGRRSKWCHTLWRPWLQQQNYRQRRTQICSWSLSTPNVAAGERSISQCIRMHGPAEVERHPIETMW